jgi:hypothetical protein
MRYPLFSNLGGPQGRSGWVRNIGVNEDNHRNVTEDGQRSGQQMRPHLAVTFGPDMSYGCRVLASQCPGCQLFLVEVKRQEIIKLDSWNVITTNPGVETAQSTWAGPAVNRGFNPR